MPTQLAADPVLVTAWASGVLFLSSEAVRSCGKKQPAEGVQTKGLRRIAVGVGAAGLAVLCVHIVLAYWITHGGSHTAAVEHVAKQTEQVIGIRDGSGIYLNFLTVAVWGLYLVSRSSSAFSKIAAVYLWLMFFSAAVVFATPIVRSVFAVLFALSLLLRIFCGLASRNAEVNQ